MDGVAGLVENGVACDILTSGLGSVPSVRNPAEEIFQLTTDQARQAVGLIGLRKCADLGVIEASL